jgi:hypothetical protein
MFKIKTMVFSLQKEYNPSLRRKSSTKTVSGDGGGGKSVPKQGAPSASSAGSSQAVGNPGSFSKLSEDDIKYSKTLMLGDCTLALANVLKYNFLFDIHVGII